MASPGISLELCVDPAILVWKCPGEAEGTWSVEVMAIHSVAACGERVGVSNKEAAMELNAYFQSREVRVNKSMSRKIITDIFL